MIYSLASVKVMDAGKFRQGFDANKPARKAAGASGAEQIYSDLENPNTVSVVLEWSNLENARRFYQSSELKGVLTASGAIGELQVRYLNPI